MQSKKSLESHEHRIANPPMAVLTKRMIRRTILLPAKSSLRLACSQMSGDPEEH